jgi:hypothetical protein
VEWVERDGKKLEPSHVDFFDVRKNAAEQLCEFFIAHTVFKRHDETDSD